MINSKQLSCITTEHRYRLQFKRELRRHLKNGKLCYINYPKQSLNKILMTLQELLPASYRHRIFCAGQQIQYKNLHKLENINNFSSVILIGSGVVTVDLLHCPPKTPNCVCLDKQVELWLGYRAELHSFLGTLKYKNNYFINFGRNINYMNFFKQLCSDYNIGECRNLETQINSFVYKESTYDFVLGKQDGELFAFRVDGNPYFYYSTKDKEYSIDITKQFEVLYCSHLKETLEKNEKEIIEKFTNGRDVTIKYDGKNRSVCVSALQALIRNATVTLEPKKLIIPQPLWDDLGPLYTQILFNKATGMLECYTDNHVIKYNHETNSWLCETRGCGKEEILVIPPSVLREKVDIEDLDPQFSIARR